MAAEEEDGVTVLEVVHADGDGDGADDRGDGSGLFTRIEQGETVFDEEWKEVENKRKKKGNAITWRV